MKKVFSIIVLCLVLASCSSPTSSAIRAYTDYREALKSGEVGNILAFWHPEMLTRNGDSIRLDIEKKLDTYGILLGYEKMEVLSTKKLENWIFDGIVFKDVVQLDISIRFPKMDALPPKQSSLVADGPVVTRELVYMVDVGGSMRILACETKS